MIKTVFSLSQLDGTNGFRPDGIIGSKLADHPTSPEFFQPFVLF